MTETNNADVVQVRCWACQGSGFSLGYQNDVRDCNSCGGCGHVEAPVIDIDGIHKASGERKDALAAVNELIKQIEDNIRTANDDDSWVKGDEWYLSTMESALKVKKTIRTALQQPDRLASLRL